MTERKRKMRRAQAPDCTTCGGDTEIYKTNGTIRYWRCIDATAERADGSKMYLHTGVLTAPPARRDNAKTADSGGQSGAKTLDSVQER